MNAHTLERRLRGLDASIRGAYARPMRYEVGAGCKDIRGEHGMVAFTVGLADEDRDRVNAEVTALAVNDLHLLYNALLAGASLRGSGELDAARRRWSACSPLPWSIDLTSDSLTIIDADGDEVAVFGSNDDVVQANALVIATVYVPHLLALHQ